MAKSLSSILSQIERLQKEANAIQLEVIARIRKDIAKYGLTADQLFGSTTSTPPRRSRSVGVKASGNVKSRRTFRTPKFADGGGNTWGGVGKRPEWLRQAIAAGHALEDFLIAKVNGAAPTSVPPTKSTSRGKSAPRAKEATARKSRAKQRAVPKAARTGKPRARKAPAAEAA